MLFVSHRALAAPIDRAISLHLASEREWLLLGHWQKHLGGYKSEVDGPNFFFAPDGKTNPEAELAATLDAFKKSGEAQCRFMARRAWLFETLHVTESEIPRDPCKQMTEWKRKLNADGISLIFASSYMNNAASMFGHTFLKIHTRSNNDDRDLLNYGVSFLARTGKEGNEAFALYGLIGAYPGYFTMSPFHETLREYTNLDGRDVWEYRLNLTPAETEHLIDHLIELEQTYFAYYFIDKNCSYQLISAIEVARPDIRIKESFFWESIPADVIRLLTRVPNLVTQVNYRPSLMTTFRGTLEPLSLAERALVKPLLKSSADLSELTPERRALVLDSAISYADILSTRGSVELKDRAYQLKIARAQTGITSPMRNLSLGASRPEQGHDPALASLGFGNRGGDAFTEGQFRFAYQGLLEDDTGYLGNTQLEALKFTVRRYAQSPGFVLQNATLLDIVSLAPADRFFQPLSWRFNTEFTRLADRPESDASAETVNGGIGYSLGAIRNKLIWFTFVQMHGDAGADLPTGYRIGSSLDTELIFRPKPWLRLDAGFSERGYYLGATSLFPATWAKVSGSLSRNLQLETKASVVNTMTEASAVLSYHFVL